VTRYLCHVRSKYPKVPNTAKPPTPSLQVLVWSAGVLEYWRAARCIPSLETDRSLTLAFITTFPILCFSLCRQPAKATTYIPSDGAPSCLSKEEQHSRAPHTYILRTTESVLMELDKTSWVFRYSMGSVVYPR
jgi:hypothetical protein